MQNTSFQIKALDAALLDPYFKMNESELQRHNARWVTADADPGYPCRVSLQDAKIGERVLLFPYNHHDVSSPYRAAGPVFVRELAVTANPAINQIPDMLRHRNLSMRAYDRAGMMIAAAVVAGEALEAAMVEMLQQPKIEYIHLHNAGPGCFHCAVVRA
ncbi:DUF1203 domain-containing protein [Marinicella litoralis]|uniref:Uncharacterized protein DUF1203 n=1 Tax=Marinicella litoralis TaxID=644220 RepID=A0A4R6XYH6_9GAMM|nr:DUF1203 domain-containing protein [Marinicella litoralis]TDR23364.1 uncharacterized protein DUF1203 [Marinicella litoralis]